MDMKIIDEAIDKLLPKITRELVTSLCFSEQYSQYNKINDYLYTIQKEKYNRHRSPGTDPNYHNLVDGTRYTIVFDRLNFMVIRKITKDLANDLLGIIQLDFIGPNRYEYKERFIKGAFRKKDNILVESIDSHGHNYAEIGYRDFSGIVLPPDDKRKIINGITRWKLDREWYKKHQLPYKIGILLYGDPGTGKSAIARAISHMLGNCDIITFSARDIAFAIGGIADDRRGTKEPFIILLEDIDMLFCHGNRKSPRDMSGDDPSSDGLSYGPYGQMEGQRILFQLLDGIYSIDNMVVIATTNYRDRLDDALGRAGRFSIQIEIRNFDRNAALEIW